MVVLLLSARAAAGSECARRCLPRPSALAVACLVQVAGGIRAPNTSCDAVWPWLCRHAEGKAPAVGAGARGAAGRG